jgi:transposase
MTFGAHIEKNIVDMFQQKHHAGDNVEATVTLVHQEMKGAVKSRNKIRDTILYWLMHGITPAQRPEAGKRGRRVIQTHREMIKKAVDSNAALYLDEIADYLEVHAEVTYSLASISRALKKMNYVRRVLRTRASQRDMVRHARCRARLRQYNPRQLLFIDETHQDDRQARRLRGWAEKGRVPTVFEPLNGNRYTVIAACNLWGFETRACEIIQLKPHVGVGGARFAQWVRTHLVPVLGSYIAGERNSVVVMDNASVHKGELSEVLRLIRGAGAVVEWLSPYSPDLNPIEEGFSKVKGGCRRLRYLYIANPKVCIATALGRVTASDMHGYFRHSGLDVPDLRLLEQQRQMAAAAAVVVAVANKRRKL